MVNLKEVLNAAKMTRNIWVLLPLKLFQGKKRVYFRNGFAEELDYSEYWHTLQLLEHLHKQCFNISKTRNGYLLQNQHVKLKFQTPFLGSATTLVDLIILLVSEGWRFHQGFDLSCHFSKQESDCVVRALDDDLFSVKLGKIEFLGREGAIYFYFFETPAFFSICNFRDKVVLDVGGFCGESAVYFWSQGAKKVIIYEPVPDHHEIIRKNIVRNNVKAEIHDEGIGEKDGTSIVAYDSIGLSFGLKPVGKRLLKLKIRNATAILEKSGADIAKIDCEGAETSLLSVPESTLRKINSYIIETHTPNIRKAIIGKFTKAGFKQSCVAKDFDRNTSMLYFERVRVKPLETQKSVAIIVVNWSQKKHLATCLFSLKSKTAYSNYHVIVVDNGSFDGSIEVVRQSFPWVDVVALDKNYGFSIGNNKGIDYALKRYKPQYVLLLNNDIEIVQSDWLSRMVASAESEENVGIVGCKLICPNGKTQYIGTEITVEGIQWLNPSNEDRLPEVFDVDAVLGACFLIKREVIDKIGFLDIGFSPFIHEESDFCLRAKKAGYRSCIVQSVSVVHFLGATVGKFNSEYVEFLVRRNAIRFMLLNFPKSGLLKRSPAEIRLFIGCFIARNKDKKSPVRIELVTDRELLNKLKVNFYGWLCNLITLPEIIAKRKNRAAKLLAIE